MPTVLYVLKQAVQGALCGLPIVAPFIYYVLK